MTEVLFFVALLVDGALAGAIYALIALAFVVVYRTSRMINFALGEWMMLASGLVTVGLHALGLVWIGAVVWACAGMVALALIFNRVVLCRLIGQPLISLIMVTLGLGALLRGSAAIGFRVVSGKAPVPGAWDPLLVYGVPVSRERLLAGVVAAASIALVAWMFHRSRMGVALRAIADDQQVAMAMGIDIHRYFAITWAMVGLLSVLAGTLWTSIGSGGFSVVLLGLKVLPIVIIGGLDRIAGCIVGAILIGVLESLTAGYVDPLLGGGFSTIAAYLVLIAMLFVRPYGLLGRADVVRV